MAEWVAIGLTGLAMVSASIIFLVRAFMGLSAVMQKNTDAIDRLNMTIDKQDARIGDIDNTIDDHEVRISNIETIHKIRGCDREEG